MAFHRLKPFLRIPHPTFRSSESVFFTVQELHGSSSLFLGPRIADFILAPRSFHGVQRRWISLLVPPSTGPDLYLPLQRLVLRSFTQLSPSKLGYASVTIKRNLSTESLRIRWETAKAQLRKNMIDNPKFALRNAIKNAPISQKTRSVLSNVVSKPLQGAKRTASRYREAVGLQFDAFWRRNYLLLLGAFGFGVCLLLWRVMFGIASMFVGLSERVANMGFLALAAAMVILAGLILQARYAINPDKVYRITMRKLNTSAAALEVLGPPLNGTDVRAYVMFGGGLRLRNLHPKLGSKRCFLIFPVRGSERTGLVNVEVKKKKGKYDFKLVAVDYTEGGREQRLYLIGDEVEYKVGGGLISELRDPIVKAMTSQKEFDEQDEKEEEDEERANSARQKEELKRLERQSAT